METRARAEQQHRQIWHRVGWAYDEIFDSAGIASIMALLRCARLFVREGRLVRSSSCGGWSLWPVSRGCAVQLDQRDRCALAGRFRQCTPMPSAAAVHPSGAHSVTAFPFRVAPFVRSFGGCSAGRPAGDSGGGVQHDGAMALDSMRRSYTSTTSGPAGVDAHDRLRRSAGSSHRRTRRAMAGHWRCGVAAHPLEQGARQIDRLL